MTELPRRREYSDELLVAFPGGQVVNPEGSVADLPFQLTSGRPTALRVSLPGHFPHDRPVLCVLVPLQHPAVDASGRVHVRGVEQWGAPGSALGIGPSDLVSVVREAFTVLLGPEAAAQQGLLGGGRQGGAPSGPNSGAGREGPMISLAGGMGPQSGGSKSGSAAGAGGARGAGRDPAEFLEECSAAQLEAMLRDEEELRKIAERWLRETPAARALEEVHHQNRSVAESNLALSRSIDEARGHVAIVRSGDYAAMRSLFEELYWRQEAVVAKLGTPRLLVRLREETDQADAASDEILEGFQGGSLSVEAFVEQYGAAREAFHVADLKRQAAEHSLGA